MTATVQLVRSGQVTYIELSLEDVVQHMPDVHFALNELDERRENKEKDDRAARFK
jgi:hypothetical protein